MSAIPSILDFDDPAYDPFISDEAAFGPHLDPYPQLAAWLKEGPVHRMDYRVGMGMHADMTMADRDHYSVLGYDAVEKVLGDPVTFSNEAYRNNLGISFGRSVSTMDAPEHALFRKIFQKAFLPQVVAKWGDNLVDPVVKDLMDRFVGRGKADLVQEFTHHYPFHII